MRLRTMLLLAAAVVVAAGVVAAGMVALHARDGGLLTDGQGGASIDPAGLPFHIEAEPGTFRPHQRLVVGRTTAPPRKGNSRVVATPIAISAGGQPARPLVVETRNAVDADENLTVGVLWNESTGTLEAVPIEWLADRRVMARIPHLSGFAILTFPSLVDLSAWFTGPVLDGVLDNVKDFFDAPYDCPTPTFATTMLELGSYPTNVHLQLDVNDNQAIPGAARLRFCNRHRFVHGYSAHGAGQADGLVLPRSTLTIDVALRGNTGDPFVVDAKLTAQAVTATIVFVGLEALPDGTGIVKDVIKDGVLDPDILTLITNATRSCQSSIDAALATPNGSTWSAAVSCLANDSSYTQAVIDVFTKKLAEEYSKKAAGKVLTPAEIAKLVPMLKAILVGQTLNRVFAEWLVFGLPKDLSFPYTLRCDLPGGTSCAPRPTPGASPSSAPLPLATSVDWRNTTYKTNCANESSTRLTTKVRNGMGTTPDPKNAGWEYQFSVVTVATGDLTNDGRPEVAVLLRCVPPSTNFFVWEVQVFTDGPAPLTTLVVPHLPDALYPGVDYVEKEFTIKSELLEIGVMYYGPNDCHACGPSIHRLLHYRWNGRQLMKT
jgi:hypothetical protein